MARVLLYNFRDETRRRKVRALLFRLALPVREVQPAEQGHSLGYLLGLPETDPGEAPEQPFGEEMLVMHDLSPRQFRGLLDGLRQQGILIPLKAVVTPHNVHWTSGTLKTELAAEHAAMNGGGTPVHS